MVKTYKCLSYQIFKDFIRVNRKYLFMLFFYKIILYLFIFLSFVSGMFYFIFDFHKNLHQHDSYTKVSKFYS